VRSAAEWRAPFVPARLQPTALLADLAVRGARHRVWVGRGSSGCSTSGPVVAELVLSRLDLTGIVTRHVDLDDVVRSVDIDAVVSRVDLDAIVGGSTSTPRSRASTSTPRWKAWTSTPSPAGSTSTPSSTDRHRGHGRGGDRRHRPAGDHPGLDRVDGVGVGAECAADGIAADDAISRGIERHLFRRRRAPTPRTVRERGRAVAGPVEAALPGQVSRDRHAAGGQHRRRPAGRAALVGTYLGVVAFRFVVAPRDFTWQEPSLVWFVIGFFGITVVYLTAAWWISGARSVTT
jgi:hypothetical protein